MEILEPVKEKDVTDLDFVLTHNAQLRQTLDFGLGDSFKEDNDKYVIYLSEKPHPSDPEVKRPAEFVTVFKSHVIAVVVRQRKQRLLTTEEQIDMDKLLLKAPASVN